MTIVIAAGRGLKPEALSLFYELAELLQAEIAAARGAVEDGLLGPELLVGMSGKKIRADLYLAFGLSGSNFHTAGIKGNPKILAVNTDPRARIMELADCSIIGDAAAVLEELLKRCREQPERARNCLPKVWRSIRSVS